MYGGEKGVHPIFRVETAPDVRNSAFRQKGLMCEANLLIGRGLEEERSSSGSIQQFKSPPTIKKHEPSFGILQNTHSKTFPRHNYKPAIFVGCDVSWFKRKSLDTRMAYPLALAWKGEWKHYPAQLERNARRTASEFPAETQYLPLVV